MIKDGDELVIIHQRGRCYRIFTRTYGTLVDVTEYVSFKYPIRYNKKSKSISMPKKIRTVDFLMERILVYLSLENITWFQL